MVTRTIEFANVTTMFVNIETQQIGNAQFKISGDVTEDKALAYVQKHYNTKTESHVAIMSYEKETKLYGMPETVFLANAIELPPRANTEG